MAFNAFCRLNVEMVSGPALIELREVIHRRYGRRTIVIDAETGKPMGDRRTAHGEHEADPASWVTVPAEVLDEYRRRMAAEYTPLNVEVAAARAAYEGLRAAAREKYQELSAWVLDHATPVVAEEVR
jgi:hypothetical protein